MYLRDVVLAPAPSVWFRRLRRFTDELCLTARLLIEDLMPSVIRHFFPAARFVPRSITAGAKPGLAIERAQVNAW